jgi:hypothetical protein
MNWRHSYFRRRMRRWRRRIGSRLGGLRLGERSLGITISAIVLLAIALAVIAAEVGIRRLLGGGTEANPVSTTASQFILIAGGYDSNLRAVTASAELYDLNTRQFSATGSMTTPRVNHTATLLRNGKVLITGGASNANPESEGGILRTAELYDPVSGKFTPTGSMNVERVGHTATLLPDGEVLIVGGLTNTEDALATAELYNPKTGIFAKAGHLTDPRIFPAITQLDNGKLLISGGEVLAFSGPIRDIANVVHDRLNTAELYTPATGGFRCVGGASFLGAVCRPSMSSHRLYQTATLLRNGRVLIAGGDGDCLTYSGRAELYDPMSGIFVAANEMAANRQEHTATLLDDGQVLIAGGISPCKALPPVIQAEIYDPEPEQPPLYNGVFSLAGNLTEPRALHTATLIPSGPDAGDVLIAGGSVNGNATAEMYIPSSYTFACVGDVSDSPPVCSPSMTEPRQGHTATLLTPAE